MFHYSHTETYMTTAPFSSRRWISSDSEARGPCLASKVGDESGVVENWDENKLADSEEDETLPSRDGP